MSRCARQTASGRNTSAVSIGRSDNDAPDGFEPLCAIGVVVRGRHRLAQAAIENFGGGVDPGGGRDFLSLMTSASASSAAAAWARANARNAAGLISGGARSSATSCMV
jgi:hypothetical protein